jgi:hypothetical protein
VKDGKIKDGGRVPRQGRHVLDGTLDRMEGASLRGPETLPPWNDHGTSNTLTQSPNWMDFSLNQE